MSAIDKAAVKQYLLEFQSRLCDEFAQLDKSVSHDAVAKEFARDEWTRAEGGGGTTCVLENGHTFEKGGVNFSHVYGKELPAAATANRPELIGRGFEAMGVSVVMHPENPLAPTSHANVRLFIAEKDGEQPVWWFGGGFDLTPYYGFREDCKTWHQAAYDACKGFGDGVYDKYKAWCDRYFYLPHRKESRGVGGLFFDDLNCWEFQTCFDFIQSVAEHYASAYSTIIARRQHLPFTKLQRQFQLYRRGRYVEFNLVQDRGTLFGLQSGGRTESILMSLPPKVEWHYRYQPEPDSPEDELSKIFLKPTNWLEH